jgi:hypothetical protein
MQLKKIALAIAAAASMVSSFAAVNTTDAPELVFMAWNAKGTFGKDLGVTLDSLTKTTTFEVAGSNWNSFLALGGLDTQWMVASYISINDGFSVNDRVLTTTLSSAKELNNIDLNDSGDVFKSVTLGQTIRGGFVANHEVTVVYGDLGDANDGGGTFADRLPTNSSISPAFVDLYRFATSNDDSGTLSTLTNLNATASNSAQFMGTTLTITAVPEPTTYAMLIAGLLGIGFMVRRRNA